MGIEVPIRLKSVEAYVRQKHGSLRELGVDELRIVDTYAERIVDAIQSQWPVDTSTSRDAFTYTLLPGRDIGFTIENDVDYAEYVHEGLWERLIPEVWDGYRGAMVADLRDAVDETESVIASEKAAGGLTQRQILAGRRPARKRRAA